MLCGAALLSLAWMSSSENLQETLYDEFNREVVEHLNTTYRVIHSYDRAGKMNDGSAVFFAACNEAEHGRGILAIDQATHSVRVIFDETRTELQRTKKVPVELSDKIGGNPKAVNSQILDVVRDMIADRSQVEEFKLKYLSGIFCDAVASNNQEVLQYLTYLTEKESVKHSGRENCHKSYVDEFIEALKNAAVAMGGVPLKSMVRKEFNILLSGGKNTGKGEIDNAFKDALKHTGYQWLPNNENQHPKWLRGQVE